MPRPGTNTSCPAEQQRTTAVPLGNARGLVLLLEAARRPREARLELLATLALAQVEVREPRERHAAFVDAGRMDRPTPPRQPVASGPADRERGLARRCHCGDGLPEGQAPAVAAKFSTGPCPARGPRADQLGAQPLDECRCGGFSPTFPQPRPQRVDATRFAEPGPSRDVEPFAHGARGEVGRGDFIEHLRGLLRPARGRRECHLRIGEGLHQHRPHGLAQAVARETRVGVAGIVDGVESALPDVLLDVGTRHVEPGTLPHEAVSFDARRHRGEACDTAAPQGLQQEGLGLVPPVMAQQHEAGTGLPRHRGECGVARIARPGLDTLAAARPRGEAVADETNGKAFGGPSPAHGFDVVEPGIGFGQQPVVDVERDDVEPLAARRGGRGVQQCEGVTAPAAGDRDDAPHGEDQRSLVSLNRP